MRTYVIAVLSGLALGYAAACVIISTIIIAEKIIHG